MWDEIIIIQYKDPANSKGVLARKGGDQAIGYMHKAELANLLEHD